MSKISGYANSVSALGTDDLLDVSEKISSSPDVYESRKMTGATLATFIQNYTNDSIYSASGTVPSSVVAAITDFLRFSGGRLDLSTTTDGFLMPRLTTAQMNAIASPTTNLLIYNTDLSGLYRYNGSAWVALSAGYGIVSVNDSNGIPTFYADLPSAIATVGNNDSITLYSNITVSSVCTIPASVTELTINGNGYTITHTSNTGSEFSLFKGNTSNKTLYLNNLRIISNGTGTGLITGVVFESVSGVSTLTVKGSESLDVTCTNNGLAYLAVLDGGTYTATNSYANFNGNISNAVVYADTINANLYKCDVTIPNSGSIVLSNGDEIIECKITADATSGVPIIIPAGAKFHRNTVTITAGANFGVQIDNATAASFYTVENCNIIHQGSGIALAAVYGSARDSYLYSETGSAFYSANHDTTKEFAAMNLVCENNATNQDCMYRNDSGSYYRMLNVTANCLNATNTGQPFQIRVSGASELHMIDCKANTKNNAIDNVILVNNAITTGGAHIYGLKMSKVGNGLNYNTVPNLNTLANDAYGNGQLG